MYPKDGDRKKPASVKPGTSRNGSGIGSSSGGDTHRRHSPQHAMSPPSSTYSRQAGVPTAVPSKATAAAIIRRQKALESYPTVISNDAMSDVMSVSAATYTSGAASTITNNSIKSEGATITSTASSSVAARTTGSRESTASSGTAHSVPGAMAVNRWGSEARVKGDVSQTLRQPQQQTNEATGRDGNVNGEVADDPEQATTPQHPQTATKLETVSFRVRLGLVLVVTLVGIAIGAGVAGLGRRRQRNNKPTPKSRVEMLQNQLGYLYRSMEEDDGVNDNNKEHIEAVWGDPISPQSKALQWLAHVDTITNATATSTTIALDNSADNDRLEVRYVLAVLYFSTNGPTHWLSHGNFLSATLHECDWNDGSNMIVCDSSSSSSTGPVVTGITIGT